ncbi:SIS domain-containing protein [Winogradskyella sp. PG-2]|uniref:D-sedoheptulose-7-phosphate isomerase n=1 Tax=Winogradskyella sp. PG-2 TaxID=754409 RepID=UPI00045892FB|nr:SIS domain-containing protein [Winogradskyella sp. PG-2]BAO75043.1 phosphoheptose isomerase 1 [Winogradskyella sp. PG-2]
MKTQIKSYLENLTETLNNLDIDAIENCANVLLKAYENGNHIFICGNGGSAATASHFACDINKGVSYGLQKRFKVIPLTDNLGTITAYTNDVGYDIVFEEQLKNFFNPGDVLVGISGSGNSKNVLKAIDFINKNGGVSVGWTGFDGGKLKELAHHSVDANINDMQISEDIHMTMVHVLMKLLKEAVVEIEKPKVKNLYDVRRFTLRKKAKV